jgi:hypothetical protein
MITPTLAHYRTDAEQDSWLCPSTLISTIDE